MAKPDPDQETEATEENASSGGLVKKILLALGLFVLVVGAQFTALIAARPMLASMLAQPAEDATAAGVEDATAAMGPPVYWPLNPPMVVNLENADAGFLQISMEVMARDVDVIEAVKTHDAAIRNALLMLFASQTSQSISSREGKQELRGAVLSEIQFVLEPLIGTPNVEDVYFTSFVAQ